MQLFPQFNFFFILNTYFVPYLTIANLFYCLPSNTYFLRGIDEQSIFGIRHKEIKELMAIININFSFKSGLEGFYENLSFSNIYK